MAATHLHSIKLDDKYHHLFNINFMTVDEIIVLFNKLHGNDVDSEQQVVLDNLIKMVSELIITAKNKDRKFLNMRNSGDNSQI